MTSEREKEIREYYSTGKSVHITELLAEIDRLRAENDEVHETRFQEGLKNGFESATNKFQKERDQLKAENEDLKGKHQASVAKFEAALDTAKYITENQKLREENAKNQQIVDDVLKKNRELVGAYDHLGERVAKLEKYIKDAATTLFKSEKVLQQFIPGSEAHKLQSAVDEVHRILMKALLAQDDELERG